MQDESDRWTLIFVRELAHAPETVWEALTDPEQLRAWAPFDADRNLGATGPATLTMAGGGDESSAIRVHRAERPHFLEYTWDTDLVRWELEAIDGGTRVTLRHTMADRAWLARTAAGWHVCIAVMERALSGDPVGRTVGEDAKPWWEPLNADYEKQVDL